MKTNHLLITLCALTSVQTLAMEDQSWMAAFEASGATIEDMSNEWDRQLEEQQLLARMLKSMQPSPEEPDADGFYTAETDFYDDYSPSEAAHRHYVEWCAVVAKLPAKYRRYWAKDPSNPTWRDIAAKNAAFKDALPVDRPLPPLVSGTAKANAHKVNAHNVEPDPRYYKTKICLHYKSGYCKNGDDCPYAHSQAELVRPDGYKKHICKNFLEGKCRFTAKTCNYAHGEADLVKK